MCFSPQPSRYPRCTTLVFWGVKTGHGPAAAVLNVPDRGERPLLLTCWLHPCYYSSIHDWLSTRIPRSFSAKVLSTQPASPQPGCCTCYPVRQQTSHLPLLSFVRFLAAHFSNLSSSLEQQPCPPRCQPL